MSLTQKRTKNLELFNIVDPTDPDYIPLSELYFLVDHASFDKSKKIYQDTFASLIQNTSSGKITGLTSNIVNITFNPTFDTSPIGEVRVYRMASYGAGYQREDVLWVFADASQPTVSGCNIIIDSDEDLTGVIVEYDFK